jgi:hypothetical protein
MAQELCIVSEKRFQTLPGRFIGGPYPFAAHAKRQNLMQFAYIPVRFVSFL